MMSGVLLTRVSSIAKSSIWVTGVAGTEASRGRLARWSGRAWRPGDGSFGGSAVTPRPVLTASRSALPGLNAGAVEAAMARDSPVADLPQTRLHELLPWHWMADRQQALAA